MPFDRSRTTGPLHGQRDAAINVAALTIIQVSNGIVPLLIFPYVLWIVKAEGFSAIVVAEAINFFLLSLVLYSFEVDGVAAVVAHRASPARGGTLSEIVWKIVCVRVALYAAGLTLLLLLGALFWPQLNILVVGWSLVSLSYAIQPNWLFQGLGANGPFAVLVLGSRSIAFAATIMSVDSPDDYLLVPFIIGFSYLTGSIAALAYACATYALVFKAPKLVHLGDALWSGKEIFLGNISTGLYRDSNVLILSVLGVSSSGIAAYSLADKAVKMLQAAMRPLNQFFFPQALAISQREGRPSPSAFRQIVRLTWIQQLAALLLMVLCAAAYFLTSQLFPEVISGDTVRRALPLGAVMAASVFPGILVFMLGIAGLNVLGARRQLLFLLLSTGFLSVVANLVLVPLFQEFGAAICFVCAEVLLMIFVIGRYFPGNGRKRAGIK